MPVCDLTTKYAKPLLVDCGFEVSRVVVEPAVRLKLTEKLPLGTGLPLMSAAVPVAAAGCGESLLLTVSLLAAPVIWVWREAELPATDALLVEVVNVQVPGVVVDWTLNSTLPWVAVAVALPGPTEEELPVMTLMMLQTFAPASRDTVMTVALSEVFRLPLTSTTSIRSVVVETPSDAIGLVVKLVFVAAEEPGAPLTICTLQPVRFAAEAEIWIVPGVSVDATEVVATPLVAPTVPVGVTVARPGVTL